MNTYYEKALRLMTQTKIGERKDENKRCFFNEMKKISMFLLEGVGIGVELERSRSGAMT